MQPGNAGCGFYWPDGVGAAASGKGYFSQIRDKVLEAACGWGVTCEREILGMSLAEAGRFFKTLQKKRERFLKDADMLAWMIGQYAAVGVNRPHRYPKRPGLYVQRKSAMSDEEMRRVLLDFAEKQRKRGDEDDG